MTSKFRELQKLVSTHPKLQPTARDDAALLAEQESIHLAETLIDRAPHYLALIEKQRLISFAASSSSRRAKPPLQSPSEEVPSDDNQPIIHQPKRSIMDFFQSDAGASSSRSMPLKGILKPGADSQALKTVSTPDHLATCL